MSTISAPEKSLIVGIGTGFEKKTADSPPRQHPTLPATIPLVFLRVLL